MERPTGKITPPAFIKSRCIAYRIIYWVLAPFGIIICRYILRISVIDRSSISKLQQKKAILISNHALYLDPLVILYAIYPRKTLFTTTQFNTNRKFIGSFIKTMGAIALPHKHSMRHFHHIQNYLNESNLIHFFPEGKLVPHNQQLKKFHKGAFYMAAKHQLPLICISNHIQLRTLFGKQRKWLPPKITCNYNNDD